MSRIIFFISFSQEISVSILEMKLISVEFISCNFTELDA